MTVLALLCICTPLSWAQEAVPKAKSVELMEPVVEEKASVPAVPVTPPKQPSVVPPSSTSEGPPEGGAPAVATGEDLSRHLIILGTDVPPATATRLSWTPSQSFEGIASPTPILIVKGAEDGPVLCLTAAIHGDELNGIEIVRRVLYNIEPQNLTGTIIGVPIVNLEGFRRTSRYLTDRRDLNRAFPGNARGSSAARIAHSFFTEVISHCDALVDLHTGSFHRTNLPQLRANTSSPDVVKLTEGFGSTVVLHSTGGIGTLRRAAVEAGIPAVTLEAGESMRLQEEAVDHGVRGIRTLMHKMNMLGKFSFWGDPEPVYYNSVWVRVDVGGILFRQVELGDRVVKGDILGDVTDPITNVKQEIVATHDGRVIGLALNQVVLPGFAAFHIGIRAPEDSLPDPDFVDPLEQDGFAKASSVGATAEVSSRVVADQIDAEIVPVSGDLGGLPATATEAEMLDGGAVSGRRLRLGWLGWPAKLIIWSIGWT